MAFVLSKLTEKYDGLTLYIINLIAGLIEYINNGGNKVPSNVYNLPLSFQFIESHENEILLDLCFMLLIILYKSIVKSKAFIIIKEIIFKYFYDLFFLPSSNSNQNSLLSKYCSSDIITDKLTFFVGLYSEALFLDISFENSIKIKEGSQEQINHIIQYLFRSLLSFNNTPGTAFNASYAIRNVLSIKAFLPFYKNFMLGFFETFVSAVSEIDIVPYFDLLFNCLKTEYLLDSAALLLLLKKCVERILKEMKVSRRIDTMDDDHMSVISNKCFNIILQLSETFVVDEIHAETIHNSYVYSGGSELGIPNPLNYVIPLQVFENTAYDLINYIKNPNKANCDMEILNIISNIQNKTQRVLTCSLTAFQSIDKLCNKNGITKIIFNFLSAFISKADNQYVNSKELPLVIEAINEIYSNGEDSENIYCSLIIQLLFMVIICYYIYIYTYLYRN